MHRKIRQNQPVNVNKDEKEMQVGSLCEAEAWVERIK